jgi:flagellar basal-body rod protein FlgF/flagellar basal-body rod protein FlgG
MFYGIYLSADGAHTQAKRLEVIAHNLANVDTPGFRRQLAILQSRPSEAVAQSLSEPGSGGLDDLAGGVRISHTAIDTTAGKVKPTGVPTDFAIAGEGYFAVQRDGQVFLTRAGNFSINPAGQLVAQLAGGEYPVLSQAGQPIVIDPTLGPWELTPSGAIRQGAMIQPLALLRPAEGAQLIPHGENLYWVEGPLEPIPEPARRVRAGYLEQSAVQPTTEMVELIEASRAIEANLNMLQLQDTTLAALVTRLLRVG